MYIQKKAIRKKQFHIYYRVAKMKVLKYKPNLTLKTLITFIGLEPKTYDEIIEYFKPADYENFTDVFKKLMRS